MGKENAPVSSFNTPEYTRSFLARYYQAERKRRWLEEARLRRAEVMLEFVIKPRALDAQAALAEQEAARTERQRALIEESNRSETGRDSLAKISGSIGSRYPSKGESKLHQPKKRKRPGWGRWGNQTRAQASEAMKAWIESTGRAPLPKMPEDHWEQILKDEEPT